MIISFNPDIFQDQNSDIQSKLAKILILLLEDNHLLDISNAIEIFFNDLNNYIFDQNFISKHYISSDDNQNLKDYICNNERQITQIHRLYLTKLVIGIKLGEIHPNKAYRIINERSLIIVENNPNDWKFIRGIIDKYQSFGDRRNIYKLIKKAIDSNYYLTYDHGGGSGIKHQLESRVNNIYKDIYKFKLMVIFDSDKKHSTDFKKDYKNLFEVLKTKPISNHPTESELTYEENDLIVWHMLYKRCIENYIPIEVIIEDITNLSDIHKANLRSLCANQIDFIQYYNPESPSTRYYYISIGKNKAKEQFPDMFLANFPARHLEDRCSHHLSSITYPDETKDTISEIEQILLKIAKII